MKTFLILLVLVPFLPALLLSPDVTYSKYSESLDIGNLSVTNTVLTIKGTEKIRHQITVILQNEDFFDGSCRPVAKSLHSAFSGELIAPSTFLLWTAKDDQSNQRDQIGLATANYESSKVSTIELNINVVTNHECEIEFDESIKIILTKKMRRWWPWNIVSDLIYSV